MKKYMAFFVFGCLLSELAPAQSPAVLSIRQYGQQHAGAIISELTSFLSLPNVAADTAGQQRSAAFIMDMMNKRGIKNVQLLHASTAGAPPADYGESDGARRHKMKRVPSRSNQNETLL
jgi:hypothetical protein